MTSNEEADAPADPLAACQAENARLRAALPRSHSSDAARARYHIPPASMTAVDELWVWGRLRGLRIYLGWWLADVADDLFHRPHR
jgi:hypothetical protein